LIGSEDLLKAFLEVEKPYLKEVRSVMMRSGDIVSNEAAPVSRTSQRDSQGEQIRELCMSTRQSSV